MQTQQIAQVEQALPLADAINQLIASYEADAQESNKLVDEIVSSEQENTFLKLQLSNMKNRLNEVIDENEQLVNARKRDEAKEKDFNKKAQMVSDNAAQHMQMLEQAKREKAQIALKLDNAMLTIASYKDMGSPKKIREQRKDYQERIANDLKAKKAHKAEVKKYRQALELAEKSVIAMKKEVQQIDVTPKYYKNGDHLSVYPLTMHIQKRGMKKDQFVIDYKNDDGRGCLMSLDENGDLVMGSMPIKPKKETKELATQLLRKIAANNNVVTYDDLLVLGG
ncbi:MAG: hypothetical protein ACJAUY_000631 [Cognaticolwellia sp.]|jgi:hypothetical protein